MSDPVHRRAALLGLAALGGCGFVPIYADNPDLRGRFDYTSPDTIPGFAMRAELEARLGRPSDATLILAVDPSLRVRGAAITAEGDTARFNVIATADWSLTRTATGDVIAQGQVDGFTSYSASSSTIATQTAEDDARNRAAILLADLIVSRVLSLALDDMI